MKTTTKKARSVDVDPRFEKVAAEYTSDPQVKRGRMFSSENVLSVNGKIFAMLNKGRFVLKLPKERVDQLVSQRLGLNWGPGPGRLMKEWVAIESTKPSWVELAREAYEFVKEPRS
ncbi:MmcQ/YjbR family DNA-binding protein [Candidatus Bathyarchaeota archaeon]|nr:MAG: MmcQ/YjbR family DNA-binding protein [Candidatus Bathyarchaeota archaeon]